MNDELRTMLAKYLSERNETLGDSFTPRGGPEPGYNLPQVSAQSRGPGAPALRGEYGTSMGDGEVSVRGSFHRPSPEDRPNWGAMLDYRKQF